VGFFQPKSHDYQVGEQTSNAIAWYMLIINVIFVTEISCPEFSLKNVYFIRI